MPRKVAITGLGVISPVGNNVPEFFGGLIRGASGVREISAGFSDKLSSKIAADVRFDPAAHFNKKQLGLYDRTTQLALVAAQEAWGDAGLTLSEDGKKRAGVYFGTGLGGSATIDETFFQLYKKDAARVSPLSVTKIMCNSSASYISIQYGLQGTCLTYSTACSASGVAIGEAYRQIKDGYMDVMVAGGSESLLTYGSLKAWESLGVMAVMDKDDPGASCRPFSRDRTGFVLGEGAAVMVLEDMERAIGRGAKIYAELAGYGTTSDAHHITGPSLDGQVRAMAQALDDAGLNPEDIGYINAHGTATVVNDAVETQAIKALFAHVAKKVPVSSTKSMHGHLLGAAGAVEFVATVLALKNGSVPPTANLRAPDPECDLDFCSDGARTGLEIKAAMSNSFAFGGTNAVLIARRL